MNLWRLSRRRREQHHADKGFTLVELLIALVLSGLLGGVVVAALFTSLNVESSTTDQVRDSNDAGLISSFLTRDAQSAGAIVPATAMRDTSVGVSTDVLANAATPSATGWSGCAQPATLVVRFSWFDRTATTVQTALAPITVVTYALDSNAQLIRKVCTNGTTIETVIGSHVQTAAATCLPNNDCSGTPTQVFLTLDGLGARAPLHYVLNATLRADTQATPTSVNSVAVPLLTLGPTASCPSLDLAGTGTTTVVGNALIDGRCGAAPIVGAQHLVSPTGVMSSSSSIVDPFLGRPAPSTAACTGGPNPDPTVVVYPLAVNLIADTYFPPGRYVFCNGLEMTSGRITGSDVMLYIAGGTMAIRADATVDLTGRDADARLLIWLATPDQTMTIAGGEHVNNLRGIVYGPTAHIALSSVLGANIGGLIGKDVTINGQGATRFGLPIPSMTFTAAVPLPPGKVGLPYSAPLGVSGGTGPYVWSMTPLPAGLGINSATGEISGTPTAPFVGSITVTVVDGTGAAAQIDYTLSITNQLGIFTANQDVGSTDRPGDSSFADPTYTVSVGQGGIGSTSDAFQFIYRSMTGDGRLTARVVSLVSNDTGAQAGVMFRESLDTGSSDAMTAVTASNGGEFLYRNGTGAPTTLVTNGSPSAPYWVRLTRVGDLFTAEWSADGVTWVGRQQTSIAMGSTIEVGLAVSTHLYSVDLVSATFDNVAITVPPPEAPVIATTAASLPYTENGTTALDPGLAVTDADNANLVSATVTMTTNYAIGQDTLAFVNQNGITGTWTPATGVLALSGSSTLANYQTALRSVTYNNTSDNPTTAMRTVTFVANDGGLDSNIASRTITVAAVNDAPVVTATGGSLAYTENGTTVLDPAITVTDVDSGNLSSATVTMTTNYALGQDTLAFVNQNGITGTWTAATGVLVLSGNTTVANYQTALRSITYNNNSDAPSTATRTVTFVANDGGLGSNVASRTITLTAVNDAPVVTASGALAYTENATTAVAPAITVADVDSANLSSATVTMTTNYVNGQDTLAFVNQNGITGTWTAATGVLALSGNTTVANYQTALRSITYNNNSDNPSTATRTVTFVANDGALNSNTASRTITVSAVNDGPVNSVPGSQATNMNTPKVFSAGNGNLISISDLDAGVSPVQVQLVSTLGATSLSGITGLAFTVGDGTADATMTFTGTIANVNAALAGLSFNPTAATVGAGSLRIVTNDQGNTGTGGILTDDDTIAITIARAPVMTASGTLAYTENNTTAVAPALTVTDADSTNLTGATVTITTNYVNGQDTLVFTTQNGITGTWNAATGAMTLSGSATVANYQAALKTVRYNTGDNPTTATRTVTFVATDGLLASNTASRTITVAAVNDAPVNTVPGSQTIPRNTSRVLTLSISDVDAGSSTVQVQLVSNKGTTTLATTSGLAFSAGNGIADATMTFTGNITDINAAMAGLSFNAGNPGNGSLKIVTNDLGNTGSGGTQSDTNTVTITVT